MENATLSNRVITYFTWLKKQKKGETFNPATISEPENDAST